MSTWDAARLASRRPLPKPRKMHGPVGERVDTTLVEGVHANSRAGKQCWYGTEDGLSAITACRDCGYHVCSCEPAAPVWKQIARERYAAEQEAARIRDHIAEYRRLFEAVSGMNSVMRGEAKPFPVCHRNLDAEEIEPE